MSRAVLRRWWSVLVVAGVLVAAGAPAATAADQEGDGSISGIVVQGDGQPLVGQQVWAQPDSCAADCTWVAATTDATGSFTVTGLLAGLYRLAVGGSYLPGASDYADATLVTVSATQPAATVGRWQLPGTGSIRGRVTDSAGAVVPDAVVLLGGQSVQRTRTGADGRYSFAGLDDGGVYGIHVVIAQGSTWLLDQPYRTDPADVDGSGIVVHGAVAGIDVVVPRHRLVGTVHLPAGTATDAVSVQLFVAGQTRAVRTTTLGSDGTYAFDWVPTGTFVVAASVAGALTYAPSGTDVAAARAITFDADGASITADVTLAGADSPTASPSDSVTPASAAVGTVTPTATGTTATVPDPSATVQSQVLAADTLAATGSSAGPLGLLAGALVTGGALLLVLRRRQIGTAAAGRR